MPIMSDFLTFQNQDLKTAAVKFFGNIMETTKIEIIFKALELGIFPKVLQILQSSDVHFYLKKECLWTLSNILATKGQNIQ